MKTAYIMLFIAGISQFLSAQDSTECRKAIQKVFGIIQNTDKLLQSGVFIEYKSYVCLGTQYGSKCGEDSAQLIMKDSKSTLISKNTRIYKDDSIQVVIVSDKKQIMITSMKIINKDKIPQMNFTGLHDSLLYTSNYTGCGLEMDGRDSCFSTTLILSKDVQKETGIKQVYYLVNKSKGVMKKVVVDYAEGGKYTRAVFEVKKADYHYGKTPFKGSALLMVFDKKGKLLKDYEGYSLSDFRK